MRSIDLTRLCRARLSAGLLPILLPGLLTLLIASPAAALPEGLAAEHYVGGLSFPVAIAPVGDGRILATEKFGAVRLIEDGQVLAEPLASFEPRMANEAGLLGLELTPEFEETGEFLVTYTPAAFPDAIHVARLRLEGSSAEVLADPWLTLPSRAAADRHFGGNLRYGPDGMLYVALSDLDVHHFAADLSRPAGSILRFRPDGTIPADNPFGPDNPIWAYGMRNTFDFDIDAQGRIWGAENGHDAHDEVNLVERGAHFGWPWVFGRCDNYPVLEVCEEDDGFVEPRYEYPFRIGPTGVVVYEGELMVELQGDIFVGGWHSGQLHRMREVPGEYELERLDPFFTIPSGPHEAYENDSRDHLEENVHGIVDVAVDHDGALLVLLSGVGAGEIIRIAPVGAIEDPGDVVEEGEPREDLGIYSAGGCAQPGGATPAGPWLVLGLLGLLLLRRRRARRRLPVLIVVTLLAMPTSAWAQVAAEVEEEQEAEVDDEGFQSLAFEIKAGADIARIDGHNDFSARWAPGLAAGAAARWTLWEVVALSADVLYQLEGSGIRGREERLSLHYLSLPLRLHGRLPLDVAAPRVFAGVAPNFLLTGSVGETSITDRLHRLDLSLIGGLGVDLPLGAPGSDDALTLEAYYDIGTRDLLDPDETPPHVLPTQNWTQTVYLLVGWLF